MQTLVEVKQYLRDNWEKGIHCPCCGQFVKRYRRKLNSGMAEGLINLYKITEDLQTDDEGWVHISQLLERKVFNLGSIVEISKLRYWKLIEHRMQKGDPAKKASGFWRITKEGKNFVQDISKVKKYCIIYNNKFLGLDGEEVGIRETLGEKFDYQELMKS